MSVGQLIAKNPFGALYLAFFILGWSYYMVATILMRGSIFQGLRSYVSGKSDSGSWFFSQVEEMLGCLMCTATEAALWTLGFSTCVFGFKYGVVGQIIGSVINGPVSLLWPVELLLMAGISFALSLAVAGEAWAIKTIVEHGEQRFLALREEFRNRELELLARIDSSGVPSGNLYVYDLGEEGR